MRGAASLTRRFWRLTVLNVLSNITVPLAGLVDTAMLGHLPDIRFLAGVALAGVIFDFLYWTLGFLRMATTGLAAQAMGRGDHGEADLVGRRSLTLALALGIAVLIVQGPLGDLCFHLLSGEPEVERVGRGYYDVRIWGAPAVFANLVLLGWFLGREESRLALTMTAAANLANVALNYVFIIRLGLAAQGAGLATMLAQYLSTGIGVAFYLRRRGGSNRRWAEVFERSELTRLLRLNTDLLIRSLCLVTGLSLFTNFSALLGTSILTANTLLFRIFTLSAYVIDGAAYSTESLAGAFHGARDPDALRQLLVLSLTFSLAVTGLIVLVLAVVPHGMLDLLTSHAEIVELAVSYRWWFALCLPFAAVAFILDGYFLGLTAGRTLRRAMTVSLVVFFLPPACLALVLESPRLLWVSLAALMAGRVVTLGWSLLYSPDKP